MTNETVLMRLPAIQQAIARLNLDTREWLGTAGVRRQTIDRLDRATKRASLAVELAQDGSRKAANLRRARDAMITYLNEMRFLCLQSQLAAERFDEAERRVEQIRAGLAELEHLELAKWPEHALPPLRPARVIAVAVGEQTAGPSDTTIAPTDSEEKTLDGGDSSGLEDDGGDASEPEDAGGETTESVAALQNL